MMIISGFSYFDTVDLVGPGSRRFLLLAVVGYFILAEIGKVLFRHFANDPD